MVLDALDGEAIVVEGHSMMRNDGSKTVTGANARDEWDWIREQETKYLRRLGLSDVMERHGAEFVNITDEVWSGRIVDPGEVKEKVEARYGPVAEEQLYGFMPETLRVHEGAPLVSLGKVKGIGGKFPSLSLKNLFGLIPDPLRSWWHGPGDARLGESIIDITRVYASYFPLYGVCEALREATAMNPQGAVKVEWGRYDIVRDLGFAALGGNLMNLDAVTSTIGFSAVTMISWVLATMVCSSPALSSRNAARA